MSFEDQERRENELLALESIYGENQFILSNDRNGGQLSIFVEVPEEFKLGVRLTGEIRDTDQNVPENSYKEVLIKHLPPIILNFALPDDYPSKSLPSYTLSCKWLNVVQLSKLCRLLDEAWNEQGRNSEILFTWMQLLSEDIIFILEIPLLFQPTILPMKYRCTVENNKFNIDVRAHQDIVSVETLVTFLIDYSMKKEQSVFENSYFNCGVCFNEKLGKDCVSFPKCKHVYCVGCMTDYFTIQINDGSVRALTCPESDCDTQADPGLVKRLVPEEVFNNYDRFLLQSTLDCMQEITYCPRTSCQSPVLRESDMKSGRCPVCQFVFCVLCKRSYHGVASCPIKAEELMKLRVQYLNATEDEKRNLEKRYGRNELKKAVEEHYSEAWIDTFSKKCPSCHAQIQKIDGCNKMTCLKCRKNFCWFCGKILSSSDPYDHFNDIKSGCFNKLFEGMVVDEFINSDDSDDEDGWIELVQRLR